MESIVTTKQAVSFVVTFTSGLRVLLLFNAYPSDDCHVNVIIWLIFNFDNDNSFWKYFSYLQNKADGRRTSIYLRHLFQSHFLKLGRSIDKHAGIIIFMAVLVLGTFCVGLKSIIIHSNVNQLWLEVGGSLEQELAYTEKSLGYMDTWTNNQLLIQTIKDEEASILYDQALLAHLRVVKQAISVEVYIGEVTWTLKDLCQLPSSPRFDEHFMEQILEIVIPCAIITPIDCFWEGSKLLGPDKDPHIP